MTASVSKFVILFAALFSGCAASSSSTVLCVKPNQPSGASKKLHLVSVVEERNLGVGYIDIETSDSTGQKLSRRCSMRLQPDPVDNSRVRVYTAVHCLYAATTDEFKNSKYTLQIFYKDGYFPVSVEFEGLASLSHLSQTFDKYLGVIPREKYRWNFAMTENSIGPCVTATQNFSVSLGAERRNIACFGKNEMRVMTGKIAAEVKYQKYIENSFHALRAQYTQITERLTDSELRIFRLRERTTLTTQKMTFYLRQIAYWLNESHCTAAPDQLPINPDGFPETQALCPYRKMIVGQLKTSFPDEYASVESVLNATAASSDELRTLHASIFACNISQMSDLDKPSVDFKTVCDLENINRFFWYRWARSGSSPALLENRDLWSIFGLNPDSYFSLYFNDKSGSKKTPRASLAPITASLGSLSGEPLNNEVMMLNFSNSENGVYLAKTDSGSILSIFGFLPVATLSTLDGEATSGGASITALPQVTSEDASSSARQTLSSADSCR